MSKIVGLLFIQRSQQIFSTPAKKKKKKKKRKKKKEKRKKKENEKEERFGWRNSQKPSDGKVRVVFLK